jgi:hypothetical protein
MQMLVISPKFGQLLRKSRLIFHLNLVHFYHRYLREVDNSRLISFQKEVPLVGANKVGQKGGWADKAGRLDE